MEKRFEKGKEVWNFVKKNYVTVCEFFKEYLIIILIAIITCIIGVMCGRGLFYSEDLTPATEMDYKPLVETLDFVKENPQNNMMEIDGSIVRKEGLIIFTVSNEDCEIVTTFDSSYNIVKEEWNDLAENYFLYLILSIVVGICATVYTFALLIAIMAYGERIIEDRRRKNI